MILHADMDCFADYRVVFNGEEITHSVYMADVIAGVVLRREPAPQTGYRYLPPEHGQVQIHHVSEKLPPQKPSVATMQKVH